MKTAISIPDNVFEAADSLAKKLDISRSALYVAAVRDFLSRHDQAVVTSQLDAVYTNASNRIEAHSATEPLRISRADVW
jgi:predicted transcriptional regulator